MLTIKKVEMRNKDRLHRKLTKLVGGLDVQIDTDMKKGADELANMVRGLAPVKTGEYRNSIDARKVDKYSTEKTSGLTTTQTTYKNVSAYGLYANYIWRFLEFGTKKMASRPHIFGPYRLMKRRIIGRINRGINKKVRAVAGSNKSKK